MWKPIETAPRDESVLVTVVPTADNRAFAAYPPVVYAAYVDDDGNICNYETLLPDRGLYGQYWKATHWADFPPPAEQL